MSTRPPSPNPRVKDELQIPLDLSTIPTPKEFKAGLQEVDHRQTVGSPGKKMDRKLVQLAQIPTTPKSYKYPIAVMGCNALANFTSHARTDFGGCECDDNVDSTYLVGSVVGYGAAPGPRPNRFGFRMPLNPCLQSRGLLPKLSGQCNWKARFLVSWSLAFAHHDRKTCSREVALCCTIRISRLTKLLIPRMPSVSDMRHEVQSEKLSLLRMLGMPDDAQTVDMSWFVDWLCEVLLPSVMILYHLHITSVLPLIINTHCPTAVYHMALYPRLSKWNHNWSSSWSFQMIVSPRTAKGGLNPESIPSRGCA